MKLSSLVVVVTPLFALLMIAFSIIGCGQDETTNPINSINPNLTESYADIRTEYNNVPAAPAAPNFADQTLTVALFTTRCKVNPEQNIYTRELVRPNDPRALDTTNFNIRAFKYNTHAEAVKHYRSPGGGSWSCNWAILYTDNGTNNPEVRIYDVVHFGTNHNLTQTGVREWPASIGKRSERYNVFYTTKREAEAAKNTIDYTPSWLRNQPTTPAPQTPDPPAPQPPAPQPQTPQPQPDGHDDHNHGNLGVVPADTGFGYKLTIVRDRVNNKTYGYIGQYRKGHNAPSVPLNNGGPNHPIYSDQLLRIAYYDSFAQADSDAWHRFNVNYAAYKSVDDQSYSFKHPRLTHDNMWDQTHWWTDISVHPVGHQGYRFYVITAGGQVIYTDPTRMYLPPDVKGLSMVYGFSINQITRIETSADSYTKIGAWALRNARMRRDLSQQITYDRYPTDAWHVVLHVRKRNSAPVATYEVSAKRIRRFPPQIGDGIYRVIFPHTPANRMTKLVQADAQVMRLNEQVNEYSPNHAQAVELLRTVKPDVRR